MSFINMDFGSIPQFLGNKTILITGATGYIAKILLEKILRIQPNVEKLYLLMRAEDSKSADDRFQDEVINKELFKVLREKIGDNFTSFISEKITAIAGDTSYHNLGLDDDQLQKLYENVDIIIHVAATTKFDERYDVALGVNTLGAKYMVNFAKKCTKIQLLIHVSTAYVCGEKKGLIHENPYAMGETLNGVGGLDIEFEKKLVNQTLNKLRERDIPEKEIRQRMKTLGSERAKFYGWPNSYVFTKAMGEMLVGQMRGDLPVVIMRPTIVCSTMKEPFPGWIEGCRTIDSVAVMYGKGRLNLLPIDTSVVYDLVPADLFINSMILAMKAHVNQPCLTIYQVGTSYRNPVTFKELREIGFHYFSENPWSNSEGHLVKVRKGIVLSNILFFEILLFLWQLMVEMMIRLASRMGCGSFVQSLINFDKKLKIAMFLVKLYKPYLFFKGIFVDKNIEKLLITARENGLDEGVFNIDPLSINWKDYFINVHFPAIVKYLF